MPNDYDYDYPRGRYNRDYYDEPYYRRQGGGYEDSYYQGYGGEPSYRGYGRGGYYNEPYRSRFSGRYYNEPYGDYDYGRSEYGDRARELYYGRGYEGEYRREPYYRGPYRRGAEERGFFERAGDEIKSWFGDEEAERRRRMDERRMEYAGRGPRGYRRSDERIREDINDRLTEDRYIDASDIEVSVNDCIVTLTGRVDSRAAKRRTEDIAESVSGVTDVSNQLRVGPGVPYATETEQPRARTART